MESLKSDKIKLGIDQIKSLSKTALFLNKKIGLITNHTGLSSKLKSSIDIFRKYTNLTVLFGPEHGIRGFLPGGTTISHYTDLKTGIPVYSLYGEIKGPTKEMLENVDILVYDIQDVGARFYTYISTLYECMKSAQKFNKIIIVLDRPNPISNFIEGPIIADTNYESFIGIKKIPIRYGLTVGELSKFMNSEFSINSDLHVIPLENYNPNEFFENTDLYWISPSPNITSPICSLIYSGSCLFEGTNISEGRGTTKPFEIIGAPWIDAELLSENMNKLKINSVKFIPTHFLPFGIMKEKHKDALLAPIDFNPHYPKYSGENCNGIQICVIDRKLFKPIYTALKIIEIIKKLYKDNFRWIKKDEKYWIDYLIGNDSLRKNENFETEVFMKEWEKDLKLFEEKSKKYLLYQK